MTYFSAKSYFKPQTCYQFVIKNACELKISIYFPEKAVKQNSGQKIYDSLQKNPHKKIKKLRIIFKLLNAFDNAFIFLGEVKTFVKTKTKLLEKAAYEPKNSLT